MTAKFTSKLSGSVTSILIAKDKLFEKLVIGKIGVTEVELDLFPYPEEVFILWG